MKTNRPSNVDLHGYEGSLFGRFASAWSRFWFEPRSAFGLHALRVLSGLLLLAWLLPLAGQHQSFFGLGQGWFDVEAYNETSARTFDNDRPPIGWSLLYLAGSSPAALSGIYWGTIALFTLFTLGVWPRITALLSWAMAVSFLTNATHYEADFLLVLLAFYLTVAYLLYGQWSRPLNPVQRVLGTTDGTVWNLLVGKKTEDTRSYAANLFVRLLQVNVAIMIFVSAIHKLQFGYWWSGVAFWFPLHQPFETTADSLRASATVSETYLFFLSLVQYAVLGWQLAFPVFAWKKNWRWLLIGGSALAWAGSALILKQPLFGPFFFIASLSFLTPGEWQWVEGKVTKLGDVIAGWFRPKVVDKAKVEVRS